MSTITKTIASLCAAIDTGKDYVLPVLADALDDANDPRAEAFRHNILDWGNGGLCLRHRPICESAFPERGYCWAAQGGGPVYHNTVPDNIAEKLGGRVVYFPTRSEAYLALAAAVMEVGM